MIDEVLVGERVRLRPVRPDDRDALVRVFSDPTVVAWWGDAGESLHDTFDPDPSESGFVIEVGDEVAGFIQCAEEMHRMYRHAAIDIALRAEWQGRGLGRDAVSTLVRHLFTARDHHRVTIDPAAANANAIRAYERVGFVPVGLMRKYELGPDGVWHDGLLMDLLAEDFFAPTSR
jgi:aminoglycoside 6'-N-acetyltransferase